MITKGSGGMIKVNVQAFINHQNEVLKQDWYNEDVYLRLDEIIKSGACGAAQLSHTPKAKGYGSAIEKIVAAKEDMAFELEYFSVVELGMRDYVASKMKSETSRRIWLHRYVLGRTMKRTAEEIGKSLSHTKRLHKKMLQELGSALYIVWTFPEFNKEEIREYLSDIGAVVSVPREAV